MIKKIQLVLFSIFISFSLFSQTICVNATEQLVGNGNPALVDPWISSDVAIASVDVNGLVLGISPGSCIVTYTDEFAVTTDFNIIIESPLDASITLTSAVGTDGQTLQFDQIISGDYYYEPLIPITYEVQNGVMIALGLGSTLPLGVTAVVVGNVLTISGTPYTDNPITNPVTFSYTVVSDGTNSCTGFGGGGPSTATASGTINLEVPCSSSITSTTAFATVCPDEPVFFQFSLINGATSASTTYGSSSVSGNTVSVNFTPSGFGNFTILVTTNGHCLNNISTINIDVPMQVADVSINPLLTSQTVCLGQTITPIPITYSEFLFNVNLPNGLILTNTGFQSAVISGTPTSLGTTNFLVEATAPCNVTDAENISITVLPALATPTITADGPTTFCQGGSVNLSSSSSSDNTWSTTSNSQTINVNSSGSYTVSVTNGTCSSTSSPIEIIVSQIPVISLGNTINPTGCGNSDGEIEILGNGSGTLSWTGTSSGSISTSLPINLNTFPAGNYDFIFEDACVSNQVSTLLVGGSAPPIPTISANGPLTFCQGDSVILTSSTATNIVWSSSETSESITIHNSGTYSVTVNENGCTTTSTFVVVDVTALPTTPSITNSGSNTLCLGESIDLSSNVSSGIIWSPSNETSQSISVTNSGDYFLTLTENGCSINSDTISILVNNNPPPAPTIAASGVLTFCQGDSVVLTSSTLNNNVWSTTNPNQSIVVFNSGTFNVSVTENGCTATSDPITVNVIQNPPIPIITANGPLSFCSGSSVNLSSSSSTNNEWSTGSTNQVITVISSGVYTVEVNNQGCTSVSLPVTVTVLQSPPTPLILADGSFTFCEGGSVNLSSTATSNFEWSTSQTASIINVNNSQTITITVTANGCSSTSTPVVVTEYANPIVILTPVDDVCNTADIFALTNGIPSGGNYTVNGLSTTTFNPATAFLGGNAITYTLLDEHNCVGSTQSAINVFNCLAVEEISTFTLTLFPNPTEGLVNLKGENLDLISSIELRDELGRLIAVYTELTETIDLSTYANGIYTLLVKGDNIEQVYKVQLVK